MGKKAKTKKDKPKKSPAIQQSQHNFVVHKKSKNDVAPPLSQSESEHLTYMRVKAKYDEFTEKRVKYTRWGIAFILISALFFLSLMFSLETKIEFLCLWILTTLICIAVLIRTDYRYNWYKELLGLADKFDEIEYDFDEEYDDEPDNKSIKPLLAAIIIKNNEPPSSQNTEEKHNNKIDDLSSSQNAEEKHGNKIDDLSSSQNTEEKHSNKIDDLSSIQNTKEKHNNKISEKETTEPEKNNISEKHKQDVSSDILKNTTEKGDCK